MSKPLLIVLEASENGGSLRYAQQLLGLLARSEIPFRALIASSRLNVGHLGLQKNQTASFLGYRWFRLVAESKYRGLRIIGYWLEATYLKIALLLIPEYQGLISSVCSPGRFIFSLNNSDFFHLQVCHSYPEGRAHWILGRLLRLLVRRIKFVFLSPSMFKVYQNYWGLRDVSSHIVPNSPGRAAARAMKITPRGEQSVLCVGSMVEDKSPQRFLETAAAYKENYGASLRFIWLGDGPLRRNFLNEVESRGLQGVVHAPGQVSQGIDEYYLRADVYLQLSKKDSLPFATLDAARFGLPIIASNVGGLPFILGDELKDYVVDTEDAAHIARKLRSLVASQEEIVRVSHLVAARYQSVFSQGAWEENMLLILRALR